MKKLLILPLLLLFACSGAPARVIIHTPNTDIAVVVEVADDHKEREVGLMNRTKLEGDHGMLFVFEETQPLNFWMKNTLIPLDMIFIDATRKIVHIQRNAIPCQADPCRVYSSSQPALYVLEVNAGFAEANNLHVGEGVSFENVK